MVNNHSPWMWFFMSDDCDHVMTGYCWFLPHQDFSLTSGRCQSVWTNVILRWIDLQQPESQILLECCFIKWWSRLHVNGSTVCGLSLGAGKGGTHHPVPSRVCLVLLVVVVHHLFWWSVSVLQGGVSIPTLALKSTNSASPEWSCCCSKMD